MLTEAATKQPERLPARAAEIPRRIVFTHSDRELASALAEILLELDAQCALLVFGRTSRGTVGRSLLIDVGTRVELRAVEVTEGRTREAAELGNVVRAGASDVVVGVGGGRTLDVAQYAAFTAQVPFVAVPTQASHDGIASPVTVLEDGDVGRVDSYGARPPAALAVPIHAIRRAPRRTIVSGIGDLAANSLAVSDWRWARDFHDERFDDYAALLGRSAADLLIARRQLYTPERAFEPEDVEVLVNGLVLSGLAMTVAGSSRPCSGSEHLISHAFDRLRLGTGLHGEQVAVGVALAARFYDDDFERVLELLRSVGAPTSPAEIGIGRDDALKAVRLVAQVRPGRRCRITEALRADEDFVLAQAEEAWFGSG